MPLQDFRYCAACNKRATLKCTGCVDAPEHTPGDAELTWYCTEACQKSHWAAHKERCVVLRKRRRLWGAARIIKKTWLAYRETWYDIDLQKVEAHDKLLVLHGDGHEDRIKRVAFPSQMFGSDEHKEAALMKDEYCTALGVLCRLVHLILPKKFYTLEHMDIKHVDNPSLKVQLISNDPIAEQTCHSIIKATQRTPTGEESWIIDPTGAQFGYRDPLTPYEAYMARNAAATASPPRPYAIGEMADYDFLERALPHHHHGLEYLRGREAEAARREHLLAFLASRFAQGGGGKPRGKYLAVFEKSRAGFEWGLGEYTSELKTHLRMLKI